MAKYEKIGGGSYSVYKEKKSSGCLTIIGWIIAIGIVLFIIGSCADASAAQPQKTSSHLAPVEGEPNLFVYVNKNDGLTPEKLAARLSITGDRFVVFVATTPKHEAEAIPHAKKLAVWFEKNIEDVTRVPIVLHRNDHSTVFIHYISGLSYRPNKKYADDAMLTPQETVVTLEDAATTYRARKILREQNGDPDFWWLE